MERDAAVLSAQGSNALKARNERRVRDMREIVLRGSEKHQPLDYRRRDLNVTSKNSRFSGESLWTESRARLSDMPFGLGLSTRTTGHLRPGSDRTASHATCLTSETCDPH